MKATRNSSVLIALSLVVLLIAAMTVASCTETANKKPPAPKVPVTTTAASVTTQVPVPAATSKKQTLKISGSTTVLQIVQKAAHYIATHPNADIQVYDGGSGVGIQAIGAKTVDIGI